MCWFGNSELFAVANHISRYGRKTLKLVLTCQITHRRVLWLRNFLINMKIKYFDSPEDLAFFKTSNNIVIVAITSNYQNGIYKHNFVLFYYEP